ncbi:hypothetical protein BVC80_1103g9 [Macleaya cordata]|uniref:Uncharacterized protein n=1 Tax=Macleaya cordata TaxID=56857 RepID=A0A200QCN3_MACCD|nr:hypothetical protein BVC80_1103g9 [Macleaya cordata]
MIVLRHSLQITLSLSSIAVSAVNDFGSARATEIPTEFATAGTFHGEIHNTLEWDAKYEEMQITLTVGCLSGSKFCRICCNSSITVMILSFLIRRRRAGGLRGQIWTAGEEFTAAGRRRKGRRSEVGRPPESRSPERRLPVAGVEVAGRRSPVAGVMKSTVNDF